MIENETNFLGSHYFYPVTNIGGNNRGENFYNLSQFNYTVPEGYIVKFNESYGALDTEIKGFNAEGRYVPLDDVLYNNEHLDDTSSQTTIVNSNGAHCIFNKIEHILNDNEISSIKNGGTCMQVIDTIFNGKNKLKNNRVGNNFYINKNPTTWNTNIGGNIEDKIDNNIEKEKLKRLEAENSPFYKSSQNKIIFKPLLSTFQDDNIFYAGSNHRFNFFIDDQWRNKFIYANGPNGTSSVVISGNLNDNPLVTDNKGKIRANILGFTLYLSVYKYYSTIPKTVNYDFTEIFTSTKIITNSTQDKWTIYIPKNTFRIFLTFIDKRALSGETSLYSPTDLRVDDIRKKINQLYIEYNHKMYPSDQYNLISMDPADWSIDSNTEDLSRSYRDLILYSGANYDSHGFSMSFQEFLLNPIWCFNINPVDIGRSENLDLTLRGKTSFLENNVAFLMCLHKSSLQIEYNDDGFIKNVNFNKYA